MFYHVQSNVHVADKDRIWWQAFAAAAIQILREQSAALQSVTESVRLRRKADLQNSIRRVTPGSLRHHLACVGVTAAADDDLTVLEVTVHTRALQVRQARSPAGCVLPDRSCGG